MEQFKIKCVCGEYVGFEIDEIPELGKHVDGLRSMSYDDGHEAGKEEGAEEAREDIALDMRGGERPLWELAAAIRRGDRAEAEIYLDRIAYEMGARAIEDVEQGRYSHRAKAAA